MSWQKEGKVEELFVKEGSFVCFPSQWVFDLSGEDLKKMFILHWRFKFFADQAFAEGRDVTRCFYESQQKLAVLFGMSENSRTKVGAFLKRMEDRGYVKIHRDTAVVNGELKPRHYIVVNDRMLLGTYNVN